MQRRTELCLSRKLMVDFGISSDETFSLAISFSLGSVSENVVSKTRFYGVYVFPSMRETLYALSVLQAV